MSKVKVFQDTVSFKTYLTGKQDVHPIFLEHRVYQGSSGAVYPYGVTDTLQDKAENRDYKALFLENDYIKIMILPELGGRVQRAYDKVNKRDFVYFNHVVKPALVGLLGPWISGGIEFNWPQHHRPTTFMPVDFNIRENTDGSASIFVGEKEPMHGLTITTEFTLYPKKALLEIKSRVYNGNATPRSFLWWSNPAVKGGDQHQSIFPPDVTAVFDHGKRAVIDFPIAHGQYYKVDYDGVDISRYKNLPVPTSYMAWHSDYDFVGAYCHDEKGGLLHIADHHVSPGKKQWSWGYGDFGQAWDRNLTDSDGPYIELMTGVYTDNQPDFTWLDPYEEKEFVQNFLPYSDLGVVSNATTKAAIKLQREYASCDNGLLHLGVYAIEPIDGLIEITNQDGVLIEKCQIKLEPCHAKTWSIKLDNKVVAKDITKNKRLTMILKDSKGQTIVSYIEHVALPTPLPSTAPNPPMPHEVKSADEAYFIAQHLEQYHHATRNNYDYYLRALEIDPLDYRSNVAMGNYEFNRSNYEKALFYANNALKRAHMLNRNSASATGSVLKANCLLKLHNIDAAYDEYFRATWSYDGRTQGYIGLSIINCIKHDYKKAYYFAKRAQETDTNNLDAIALSIFSSFKYDKTKAQEILSKALLKNPVNALYHYFAYLFDMCDDNKQKLIFALNNREINYISILEFLIKVGDNNLALDFGKEFNIKGSIANLIYASLLKINDPSLNKVIAKAQSEFNNFVRFPNQVFEFDRLSLLKSSDFALHLCACFKYSHRSYEVACDLWNKCLDLNPNNIEALRGLGIHAFNKLKDNAKALSLFAKALDISNGDERLLFENDLLLKLTAHTPKERLAILEKYNAKDCIRDDLKAELVTLYNQELLVNKAYDMLTQREFHVWEGGEGRVTGQYINNAILRAHEKAQENDFEKALEIIVSALSFPHNLGEGKLVVQTDNDLYFYAFYYANLCGKTQDAKKYIKLAQVGNTTIQEQLYYNDLPCDYVLYNALAKLYDNKAQEANAILNDMLQWSYDAFNKEAKEDFFAVSLPDLVVLDRNLQAVRHENCLVVRMLAHIGLHDEKAFLQDLEDLKSLQPSNFKLSLYKKLGPSLIQIAKKEA